MEEPSHPYVYRDEPVDPVEGGNDHPESDDDPPEGAEVVIVDGRAMSYRWYRR